jgi:hypothetical protein
MLDRFLKLSLGRKLIVAAAVAAAPPIGLAQFAFVTASVFEGGQKFGIVVTSWTVLLLAATFAWKAVR